MMFVLNSIFTWVDFSNGIIYLNHLFLKSYGFLFHFYKPLFTITNSCLWFRKAILFFILTLRFNPISNYFYNISPRICNLALSCIFWKCKTFWKYVFQCLRKHMSTFFKLCAQISIFQSVPWSLICVR